MRPLTPRDIGSVRIPQLVFDAGATGKDWGMDSSTTRRVGEVGAQC